ncbi:hypothetical protein CHS0354_011733 [Potamilus streckersoni]|uniref:Uncharacterized protein n=1 Tax=Potamilus streckersoni TaxID=2493646 RepID=A0AAE0VW90_9BIVA|nr:hypothetical protein CHS0354_011733 [Potamilus streckersoni]
MSACVTIIAGEKYIEDIEIRFPLYEVKLCHVELVQQLWIPRTSLSLSCVPKQRKG